MAEDSAVPDHGPGRPPVNMIQVARLLSHTEERLLDTERDLIKAVRRTILVTEGMISLVRTTTATTHALMAPLRAPLRDLHNFKDRLQCGRVAMAKDLVRVVEGLNHTAGSLNEATDMMIKLSNNLSPREELDGSCIEYLTSKMEAAQGAVRSISQVQKQLQVTVQSLGTAAAYLESDLVLGDAEDDEVPERRTAIADLRAMVESVCRAVQELLSTTNTLTSSASFLQEVLSELQALQVCPEMGAVLLEQLECPVCYQLSTPPAVWVCCYGHLVCASCRLGVFSCPSCRAPLPSRPALLLTAWITSLRGWCANRHRGCTMLLGLGDRAKHQEACEHRVSPSQETVPSCLDEDEVAVDDITVVMLEQEDAPAVLPDVVRCVTESENVHPAVVSEAVGTAAVSDEVVGDTTGEPSALDEVGDELELASHSDPSRKRLRTRRKGVPCAVM